MMKNRTERRITGDLGEDIACKYLITKGFKIIERNYLKKFGEIDIIAEYHAILHFIEVKSVSREITDREEENGYRPEENVHAMKIQRLGRAVQAYLAERNISHETGWQFDVIAVHIDKKKLISKVFMLENAVL